MLRHGREHAATQQPLLLPLKRLDQQGPSPLQAMAHQGIGGFGAHSHLGIVLKGVHQRLPARRGGLVPQTRTAQLAQQHVVLLQAEQQ